jgi:hypothetical protein
MNKCDKCGAEKNTLYDLYDELVCLTCVYDKYGEGRKTDRLILRSPVTGEVNIERRRRSMAKRARK